MAAVTHVLSEHQRTRSKPSKSVYSRLDDYQQDAVHFFEKVKHAALFFEQGTGKTWITGGLIERMLHRNFVALGVVRLSNLESTWLKFLRDEVGITVCLTLDQCRSVTGPRILLINYEGLPAIRKALKRMKWSLVFYDEAQGLKNRNSLAARIAAQLSPTAERRLILSGTPLDERPIDLWAPFRFLVPHVFGTRWLDFEAEYLEEVSINLTGVRRGSLRWIKLHRAMMIRKNKRGMRKDKLPKFLRLARTHALRVTKDVLDLPPCESVREEVDLWGKQRQLYEEMATDLVSSTLRLTAPLRITQIGKLQQITGGYVVDDDGITHHVGSAKMRRVKRILRTHREPIVVFAKYLAEVEEIARVCDGMGLRQAVIQGKNKKSRGAIIEQFQSGNLDVIICQIKTGGVGIDLYRARRAIVYSSTHSHIDFDQAISRLHRRGQTQHVYIHKIITRSTIDEAIDTVLQKKGKATRYILDHLRKEHHERQAGSYLQVQRRDPRLRPRRAAGHGTRHAA